MKSSHYLNQSRANVFHDLDDTDVVAMVASDKILTISIGSSLFLSKTDKEPNYAVCKRM